MDSKIAAIFNADIYKIILSGPMKGCEYTRAEITRCGRGFQAAMYTAKQVFHQNLGPDEAGGFAAGLLGSSFAQYTAWDGRQRFSARVSKKGKLLTTRTPDATQPKEEKPKNRVIRGEVEIPVLTDMGADRDKRVQINRFLELASEGTHHLERGAAVYVIDFGCGKAYLTFVLYHYLSEIRGLRVRMLGLDRDGKMVDQNNEAAFKYGYGGLEFIQSDIAQLKAPFPEDWGHDDGFKMAVCLHACDTATDYALYNAVRWNADLICVVPCCQHELRGQMQGGDLPLFSRYGIIQERTASLATDAIRAALLEWQGYKAQVIELTDPENTAKNLMIRASKVNRAARREHEEAAHQAVRQVMAAFGFEPALWRLLH
jgi:SAM-dependent methyltransferase